MLCTHLASSKLCFANPATKSRCSIPQTCKNKCFLYNIHEMHQISFSTLNLQCNQYLWHRLVSGNCLYRRNCTPTSVRAWTTVRTAKHTYTNAPPERHFSITPCPCICKAYKAHPLFLSPRAVQKSLFCAIHHHAIPVILPGALLCLQMPDTCVLNASKWRQMKTRGVEEGVGKLQGFAISVVKLAYQSEIKHS